jgi:hypothetical protein
MAHPAVRSCDECGRTDASVVEVVLTVDIDHITRALCPEHVAHLTRGWAADAVALPRPAC